jgi:general secretion pathway protein H
VTAKTPISAPGSKQLAAAKRPRQVAGFTLIELLVVLMLIAMVSGMVGLALRDGSEARLEREALRLAALLEAGRAEARATGTAVRFELVDASQNLGSRSDGGNEAFRFIGAAVGALPLTHWLDPDMRARIDGARALRLGPEPLIGAQRIVLMLGDRQLVLATDGLAPFAVQDPQQDPQQSAAQAAARR